MDLPALLHPNCNTQHKWLQMDEEVCRTYNSHDSFITARLQPVLERELEKAGQLTFWHQWKEIIPVAIEMQERGFGQLDWDELDRVEQDIRGELHEIEAKLLAACPLFDQLEREAEEWHRANEEADWAAVRAKNAKRRHPKPEEELRPTREVSRARGYQSRLRKAQERRESFFNQSNDLRWFLFDHLGLRPAPPTRDRPMRSVGDAAIRYIYDHLRVKDRPHKWVLEDLSHVIRLRTVLKMFINPLRRQPGYLREGRLYPTFRLYGAETLRWSVAEPPMHSWPPRMRSSLRAAPGKTFIAVDYSQIEAGIAAILAGDEEEIREWLDPDGDLHRLMACDGLGFSRSEWDEVPDKRRGVVRGTFKSVRYNLQYGGDGTKSLGKQGCICSRPECSPENDEELERYTIKGPKLRAAVERYYRSHPKMMRWRERHIEGIRENGNSWTSPFGYRMVSCKPLDHNAIREWLNRPPQHCVAMIINRALIKLRQEGCPLVFQHHDAIYAEVWKEEVEHWRERMVAVMTEPVPELSGISFPVDVAVGETWAECK